MILRNLKTHRKYPGNLPPKYSLNTETILLIKSRERLKTLESDGRKIIFIYLFQRICV